MIKTVEEVLVGIGLFALMFFIIWMATSIDIIGVFFVSTVLFVTVFLPIILGTEEK